jgi:hypothetical protein
MWLSSGEKRFTVERSYDVGTIYHFFPNAYRVSMQNVASLLCQGYANNTPVSLLFSVHHDSSVFTLVSIIEKEAMRRLDSTKIEEPKYFPKNKSSHQ